jgi:Zn-finger protein
MKKLLIILMAVALVAGFSVISSYAEGDGNGIVGSPHDFTDSKSAETGGTVDESWNARGEICRVCHIPHDNENSSQYYLNGLLWNHKVSSATYTMYSSETINGTQSAAPDGTAKLCLGCHDGTVALDSYDKYAGTTGNEIQNIYSGGLADLRVSTNMDGSNIDLRGVHPVSIVYDPTADPNLNPTTTSMGASGTIADVLDNGKVQCSSCHDVHNQESVGGTHLLRVAQTGTTPSGLCLTCHIK